MNDSGVSMCPEPSPLGFRNAIRIQTWFLWVSRRPLWLLVGLISALYSAGWMGGTLARVIKLWPIWFLCVGPLWAFAVWYGEPPSKRRYLWSHPVRRSHQSLARTLAGLGWLWVMLAVMLACLLYTSPEPTRRTPISYAV